MRLYLTLFAIFSICTFNSCTLCSGKKVTCPAFNEPAFNKWFPYVKDSRMLFKNTTTADTFSYTLSIYSVSATYETTRGGLENSTGNRPCGTSAYYSSQNYDNSPYGITGINYVTTENTPNNKELTLYFNQAEWSAGEITDNNFAPSTAQVASIVSSIQDLAFDNGRNYPLVSVLTNDTAFNKTDRPYKIFIAKNIGIIGIEMFPSLQKWVIQ